MQGAWVEIETDVLVVGAGAAGLRAAIAAAEHGARVAVACKSLLGKAGTVLDSSGPEGMEELETWGALPLATRGARIGLEVLRTLQYRAVEAGIDFHMECSIHRLLVSGDRIAGGLGVRRADGVLVLFRCGAVVLAAGSAARAWKKNSASADATGDAFALALDVGAELADMDRVQFDRDGACRHGLGGVRVDPGSAASRLPGLYAAGDAAAVHNKALSGALLFGCRAGVHAAEHARARSRRLLSVAQLKQASDALLRPLGFSGDDSAYGLLAELQDCMQLYVGLERSAEGLALAIGRIGMLKARAASLTVTGPRAWNPAWHLALELRSLCAASEATVRAAIDASSATAIPEVRSA